MVYVNRLAQESLACRLVAFISGIPVAFVQGGDWVPVGWQSPLGYIWRPRLNAAGNESFLISTTLIIDRLEDASIKLRPKGALPTAGSFEVTMKLEGATSGVPSKDLLRDLLATSAEREGATVDKGLVAQMVDDLAADDDDGFLGVLNDPWAAASGQKELHIGQETITAFRNVSTASIGPILRRGEYRSPILNHVSTREAEAASAPNGMPIFDRPSAFGKRVLEVHLINGFEDSAGNFTPYGAHDAAGIEGAEHSRILAGIINKVDESDPNAVTFKCRTIHSRFSEPLVRRYPTGKLIGRSQGIGARPLVFVADHNNFVKFKLDVAEPVYFNEVSFDATAMSTGDQLNINDGEFVWTAIAGIPTPGVLEFRLVPGDNEATRNSFVAQAQVAPIEFQGAFTVFAQEVNERRATLIYEGQNGGDITITTNAPTALIPIESHFKGYSAHQSRELTLIDPDPLSGAAVPTGLYEVSYLVRCILATINSVLPKVLQLPVVTVSPNDFTPRIDVNAALGTFIPLAFGQTFALQRDAGNPLNIYPSQLNEHATWTLYGDSQNRESVIRYLGFEDQTVQSESTEVEDLFGQETTINYLASSDPVPVFRWPASRFDPPIWVFVVPDDQWSDDNWLYTHQFVDDDGVAIPRVAQIDGLDLFAFTGFGTFEGIRFMAVERLQSTRILDEAYAVAPIDQNEDAIVRVVPYLNNTSVSRAMRYMLESGSGANINGAYDAGWPQCGLSVRPDLVDGDSFDRAALNVPQRRNQIVISPGMTFEDFSDECVLNQQFPIIDAQGRLSLLVLDPPLESDFVAGIGPPVRDLVHGYEFITPKGLKFQRDEAWVANKLVGKYDWNPATGEWDTDAPVTVTRDDSIQRYGVREPIELEVKFQRGGGTIGLISGAGRVALDPYAEPYTIYRLDQITTRVAWSWSGGDLATLTHPYATKPKGVGVGVSGLRGRLTEYTRVFKGRSGRGGGTFAKAVYQTDEFGDARRGHWGPSGQAIHDSGARWTIQDHIYSDTSQDIDSKWFIAAFFIRIAAWGDFSAIHESEIAGVLPGGQIELDDPPAWTTKSLIWFGSYNDPSLDSRQQAWVALADNTNRINNGDGGQDAAFKLL